MVTSRRTQNLQRNIFRAVIFLAYFQVITAIPRNAIERAKITPIEKKNRLPVKKYFPAFIRNLRKPF